MEQPLISVIVPVYRAERYLSRCVQSIRNQTYRNLEIILVDDGSPDNCGEMCDQYAREDSRIRVFHKENGGQSSARNLGLDNMTGEFVGFVDSDDWIEPDMYETLCDLACRYEAQIVCCGAERVSDKGHMDYFNPNLEELLVLERDQAMEELLYNFRVTNSLWDKLFRKDIFAHLRMTEGIIYEDCDVMYRCIYRANRVVYTAKPLYLYYLSENSTLRGNISKKHYDILTVQRKRLAFYAQYSRENLLLARAKYVESALDVLYRSRKAKDCSQLRKTTILELRQMLADYPDMPFARNIKLKLAAFHLGMPCYGMLITLYYWLKRSGK